MRRLLALALIYYFILSSYLPRALSLKCRTGNQQSDDQFRKIIQACQKRSLSHDDENHQDYNRRETDSQESSDSSSDEDLFDNKFLNSGRNRYNKNDKVGSGNRYNYFGSSKNTTPTQLANRNKSRSSINNVNNNNRWSYDYNRRLNLVNFGTRFARNNGFHSRLFANNYSNKHNHYNNNNNDNNNNNYNNNNMNRNGNYNDNDNNNNNNNNRDNNYSNDEEQACIVQCFFNELNMVDEKGFPERSAVIGAMTQNIQDPDLQDFVEESVVECYHYLGNDNHREKCKFAQDLLLCLAEKGSEKCEDWDDEYL